MVKPWMLFHKIGEGGEESAAVRSYIVAKGLTDSVEYRNIAYEEALSDLRTATGGREDVPTLIAEGTVLVGKDAILKWLGHHP